MVDKLRIEAYYDDGFSKQARSFVVQINPASYAETFKVQYSSTPGIDSSGSPPQYKGLPPRTLTFEMILDGTGAVPGSSKSVQRRIDEFRAVVYQYEGRINSPKYVWILWGSLTFYGVLTNCGIDYTLFDPAGVALRAKVKADFAEYRTAFARDDSGDGNDAPDMTQQRQVVAGDTLPALCQTVYGDASHYLRIAKHNDLMNFRALKPGVKLKFPPLGQLLGRAGGR